MLVSVWCSKIKFNIVYSNVCIIPHSPDKSKAIFELDLQELRNKFKFTSFYVRFFLNKSLIPQLGQTFRHLSLNLSLRFVLIYDLVT